MAGKNRTPMVPPRQTTFSPHLENLYQAWAESNRAPQTNDYDMRGYFMDIMRGKAENTDTGLADLVKHYPDTYKLPNHSSFSNESKYSTGKDDPYWIENPAPYNPPAWKLQGTDIVEQPMQYAQGGRVNFDTGGAVYPDYYNITTPPVRVTAAMPTDEEKAAYFASHDAEGNPLQRLAGEGLSLANLVTSVPNFIYSTAGSTMDFANQVVGDLMHGRRPTANWDLAREHAASAARPLALPSVGISALASKLGITPEYEQSATNRIMGKVGEGIDYTAQSLQDKYGIPAGGTKTLADTLMITGVPGAKPLARSAVTGAKRAAPVLEAAANRVAEHNAKVSANMPAGLRKQAGAIFPEGTPKRMVARDVDLKGRAHPDEDIWPRFKWGVHSSPLDQKTEIYIESLPVHLGLDRDTVITAWNDFIKTKAKEMYPDAPSNDSALGAFNRAYQGEDRQAVTHQWLDEFSKTNTVGMPDLDVLKSNEVKAITALEQTYPNMVAKNLGQVNKDFMLDLAKKDLPLTTDVQSLVQKYNSIDSSTLSELRKARAAAGLPEEGLMQKELDKIHSDIDSVDSQLEDLTRTKWEMENQWTDRDNQPAPEGYKELTRQETKLTNQKAILQKQAKAMESAPIIETFHDLAVARSESPSEMKDLLFYSNRQFHPYLAAKKDPVTGEATSELVTPESARIVQPRQSYLRASGLEEVMKDYAMDIYLGKTNKSPEQYILQKAQELKKGRDAKAAAEAKREELTKANYMSYVDAAPPEKVFGNYAAIEFTPSMSAEELGKGLSIDTDVLNHCVGSGGMENGKHFGIWDPATGTKRKGIRSPISNEINQIINDNVNVTSIRDKETGKPVVTVKMIPDGRQFRLGFVSGDRNGAMDYKAAPALRDYLNSRSADISKGGSELSKNGVYDLKTEDGRYEAARANSVSRKEIEDFVRMNPDTPRFATKDDVKAMKPQPVATRQSPTSADSLETLMGARDDATTNLDLALDEGQPDNVLNDLRQRIVDIDYRINRINQEAPNPVTDVDIDSYINNMDPTDIRAHLEEFAADNIEPDQIQRWVGNMMRNPHMRIESLRETVRAQLENNPDQLQNLRDITGEWEPEAPMTLPTQTLPDRVIERLNILENLPDEILLRSLNSAERNAPNTIWHGLDEEQTREAVTAIEYEIGRRGLEIAHLGEQAPAIPVPTEPEGYVTPRINAYLYRLEQDAPRLTEDQFVERANRIFARAQEQNITQDQYNTLSNRMRRMHHNLRDAEPDMQLTGLTPPTAMQTRLAEHLAEMQLWTDEGLRRNIRNLTQHHPQTIYADLNEEMTEQALRLMQTELESRGLHMAEGGEVNIRPSGNCHASKAGDADIKQYTKGLDIDLFNKYGVGITKQGVTVSLPDEKFKQSDISEMRARYRTDDNTEYGISKRPLENRVTLSRSNPKDQSEWRADFSPDYKGISYSKRFAQGGLVYDEQHVAQIANELLGAMNG